VTGDRSNGRWTLCAGFVLAVLAGSLVAHSIVLQRPHQEGDEVIYRALMDQVRSGAGYTLRGHPLLERSVIDPEVYDKPVFPQHPPGGVMLFLACDLLTPGKGASTAQIFAYGLFFVGALLLWFAIEPDPAPLGTSIVAVAAAFSPIASHVVTRQWLDGPLLGFTTLGAGVLLLGVRSRRWFVMLLGGVLLAWAAWTKLTAIAAFPWIAVLVVAIAGRDGRRFGIRATAVLAGAAIVAIGLWEGWMVSHGMSLGGSLRPSSALLESSRYLRTVTVNRSPFIYFTFTPLVVTTFIPSAIMLWILRSEKPMRGRWLGLALWIVGTLFTYSILGALGYSKLLRYAVLLSPAAVVLFASLAQRLAVGAPSVSAGARWTAIVIAVAGLALEIAQGGWLTFHEGPDVIVPLVLLALLKLVPVPH